VSIPFVQIGALMKKINKYIDSFISYPNQILERMEEEHQTRINIQPNMTKQGASLLYQLILLKDVKSILEIGTCIGYSAIWAGEALKITGGKMTTLEKDIRFVKENIVNIGHAGLNDYVKVVHTDARDYIESLDSSFDMIIIDSNKPLYNQVIDKCIELLKPKGIIFADDTLFLPMGFKDRLAKPMDQYNHYVVDHPQLYTTILPLGDGITLSIKK
jgi:predicted O-methyltransferase YrrM